MGPAPAVGKAQPSSPAAQRPRVQAFGVGVLEVLPVAVSSSPSDFLIASSPQSLVGNSQSCPSGCAGSVATGVVSLPRVSAAPSVSRPWPGQVDFQGSEGVMARKFDDETLAFACSLPLSEVLDKL